MQKRDYSNYGTNITLSWTVCPLATIHNEIKIKDATTPPQISFTNVFFNDLITSYIILLTQNLHYSNYGTTIIFIHEIRIIIL